MQGPEAHDRWDAMATDGLERQQNISHLYSFGLYRDARCTVALKHDAIVPISAQTGRPSSHSPAQRATASYTAMSTLLNRFLNLCLTAIVQLCFAP